MRVIRFVRSSEINTRRRLQLVDPAGQTRRDDWNYYALVALVLYYESLFEKKDSSFFPGGSQKTFVIS